MDDRDARRIAREGQFHLREAILGLLENYPEGLTLDPTSEIPRLPDAGYNATALGQLRTLEAEGKVHQPRGLKTAWSLTEPKRKERTL